jgi:hypothetical protein
MKPALLAISLAALALAACGDPAPEPTPDMPGLIPPTAGEDGGPPAGPGPADPPPAGALPSFAATPAAGEELPPSQTTPGPIPLDYRHVWAIEPADCTADPALTRISIAPGAIRFYEGRAVVTGVTVPHEGAVTLEVDHMAEGETSAETHALALEDNGQTLAYQRRGASFSYTRCPG